MRVLPIAMLTAWVILASAACFGSSGDDEEDQLPELTLFPSDTVDRLHEIRDRVSEIRGLPVNDKVREGTMATEALRQYSQDQWAALEDEDVDDVEVGEGLLKLLGLIPADYSIQEDYASDSSDLVGGFYDPETEQLVVISEGGELSMADEITLAHEYTHSLQDGEFDLEAFIEAWTEATAEDDGYSSYRETLRCLFEGDAVLTQILYAEAVFGADWQTLLQAEAAASGATDVEFNLPPFLLRSIAFSYNECATFVRTLYDEGGWDAVNAAYVNPPATTEQVLHPEKYRSGELASGPKPEGLGELLEGWSAPNEAGGQFGEYDIFNYFVTRTGDANSAIIAAQGWGAGWISGYRDDTDESRLVAHVAFSFDSAQDQLEFLGAFGAVLGSYGVNPASLTAGDTVRWNAPNEFGKFGAVIVDNVRAKVDIRIATDEAALVAVLP